MLDLLQLQTFCVVAVTSNFRRAAVQLGYSQSSVTFHIQSLERELGASLIERRRFSRSIALTDAGQRTLEYAERLLSLAAEFKAAVSLRANSKKSKSGVRRRQGPEQ